MTNQTIESGLFQFLLRLGDNCLILGQRLSEWCGHGPILEEDIALTNVTLDILGQARLWLSFAAEVEGRGHDEDTLAYLRDAGDFRNVLLVELPNGNYAATTTRQFYFDTWHYFLLQELQASANPRIADIARQSVKEVSYHLNRSSDWIIRLGDGTDESHHKVQHAIDELWRYTGEMFEMDDVDQTLLAQNITCDLNSLREPWLTHVSAILDEGNLVMPKPAWMHNGGKRGVHTEHLGYILSEMQFLQRAYPGAQW